MNHTFNVEIAVKYGILEAILFENIAYWVDKNRANNVHFHEGIYWTYNSAKAFSELFPYASSRTISRALHRLCEEGLIAIGNYNTSPYDRTAWYALTEAGMRLRQNVAFHLPDCQMEASEMSNQNVQSGEPIPDINTDINTDINVNMSSNDDIADGVPSKEEQDKPKSDEVKKERLQYVQIKNDFNNICKDLPEVQAMSEARKRAVRLLINELESLELMHGLSPCGVLQKLFQMVQESDFLTGRSGKWGKCSFDWIINKKNALKILEGNYANEGGGSNGRNGTESGGACGSGGKPLGSTTAEALERYLRNCGERGV